jgi:hypothetical protein
MLQIELTIKMGDIWDLSLLRAHHELSLCSNHSHPVLAHLLIPPQQTVRDTA